MKQAYWKIYIDFNYGKHVCICTFSKKDSLGVDRLNKKMREREKKIQGHEQQCADLWGKMGEVKKGRAGINGDGRRLVLAW